MLTTIKLTQETKKILKTRTGYRCMQQVSAEDGYYKPLEVFNNEIIELGNSDILETIKSLYNEDRHTPDDVDAFCKFMLKTDDYSVIWLASDPLDALECYSDYHKHFKSLKNAVDEDGEPIPVNKYILPRKHVLLSDLGFDGALFAYSNEIGNDLQVTQIN